MATERVSEDRSSALSQSVISILAQSGNCAQTSFAVLQEAFDLPGAQILKALTPFPGIGLRGETCGAVVGCMMALGLVYGRDDLGDWKGYIGSLPPTRRFCRQFVSENGSTACATILETRLGRSFDLASPVEAAEYVAAGGQQACAEVITNAVHIAGELMRRKA